MNIRDCRIEDAEIIHRELGCNPAMMRYTGWNPYITLDSTKSFLENTIHADKGFSWSIEQDGTVVGTIGAYDYDEEDGSIELGYSVFQKHWGCGYAMRAVALACDELASRLEIRRVKAWSASENTASKKVLERNGFRETGIRESAINVDGKAFDQVFYEKTLASGKR